MVHEDFEAMDVAKVPEYQPDTSTFETPAKPDNEASIGGVLLDPPTQEERAIPRGSRSSSGEDEVGPLPAEATTPEHSDPRNTLESQGNSTHAHGFSGASRFRAYFTGRPTGHTSSVSMPSTR